MQVKRSPWFDNEIKKLDKDNDSLTYKYILDFSENVLELLSNKGIKNKNKFLSQKLNCSPAYITKLFNGRTNFTVHKLVEIASALDYELKITLRPKLVQVKIPSVFTTTFSSQLKQDVFTPVKESKAFSVKANYIVTPVEPEFEAA